MQFRVLPNFLVSWTPGNKNESIWYRYFQAAEIGEPPSAETSIVVLASPFVFISPKKGYAIISGGAVTSIMVSRTLPAYFLTGQLSGVFPLAQGDVIKVTYSAAPTMTFFPT